MVTGGSSLATGRLTFRRAGITDVAPLLRLVGDAIEQGCSGHYGPRERRAVFLSYAQSLFVDVVSSIDVVVAEVEGRLVGLAELDRRRARLRALFVAAEVQGQGLGQRLLAAIETMAIRAGLRELRGSMSLNAEPFYARAGFVREGGVSVSWLGDTRVRVVPMRKRLARGVVSSRRP